MISGVGRLLIEGEGIRLPLDGFHAAAAKTRAIRSRIRLAQHVLAAPCVVGFFSGFRKGSSSHLQMGVLSE